MGSSNGGGVKVTYIETQFVTSDAASFKSVVQSLTGKSAEPARPLHRPRPCRAGAGAGAEGRSSATGSQGYDCYTLGGAANNMTAAPAENRVRAAAVASDAGSSWRAEAAPTRVDELHGLTDFSELLYAATQREADEATTATGKHAPNDEPVTIEMHCKSA
ncbi:hypothetical protein BRADI_3g09510v3, partial [Brachypodium distachyon]